MDQTQILSGARLLLAVIALNLANAVAFMDLTSVSSVSSAAAVVLNAQKTISWASTSSLVAACIGQCILGYLSDEFGRRRMLVVALCLFILGSLGCGLCHWAAGAPPLYVCRAVTGAAVGSISNLVNITQNDYLTPEKRAKYQGVQGASVGVGSLLGFLCGAAFALRDPGSLTGWPMEYFVQAGLGACVLASICWLLPSPPARSSTQPFGIWTIDWLGIVFGTGAVVPALIAATEGDGFGWTSRTTIALFVGSGVCTASFVASGWWGPLEVRGVRARPIVPFRLFRNTTISAVFLQCVLSGMAYYTFIVFMPSYLATTKGLPKMEAAAMMVPYVFTHAVWSTVSPQVMKRQFGTDRPARAYRCMAGMGFTLWATAMLILGTLGRPASTALIVVLEVMIGLGTGSVFQNSVNTLRSQVAAADLAVAISARNVIRYLGGAIGTAVCTAISEKVRARDLPAHLEGYADETMVGGDVRMLTPEDEASLAHADFAGLRAGFFFGGVAVGIAAFICFFIRDVADSSDGDLTQEGLPLRSPGLSSPDSDEYDRPKPIVGWRHRFVRMLLRKG
ncbi:hypothetical protein LTR53_012426 [Teratosphaeriaceae sp. CCFEE 6253]|nr:hypothetical protein LTR53_012426 [Teratosphaeriaceae sp. CCFEE 6253]